MSASTRATTKWHIKDNVKVMLTIKPTTDIQSFFVCVCVCVRFPSNGDINPTSSSQTADATIKRVRSPFLGRANGCKLHGNCIQCTLKIHCFTRTANIHDCAVHYDTFAPVPSMVMQLRPQFVWNTRMCVCVCTQLWEWLNNPIHCCSLVEGAPAYNHETKTKGYITSVF